MRKNLSRIGEIVGYRRNGLPIFLVGGGAPTPLEIMQARLEDLRKESEALYEQRGALIDKAASEKRGMTDAEQASYDEAGTKRAAVESQIGPVAERVAELEQQEKREAVVSAARVSSGQTGEQRASVNEPDLYRKGGPNSFFADGFAKFRGDSAAADRLARHTAYETEKRALGNTGAVGGSGGEFAAPSWLMDEWVNLIRPSRITANLFHHEELPMGISSLNYPKLSTGTTTAIQTTQNSALSSTDPATTYIQTGIATVGGKNVLSQQLIDQSKNFDQVVVSDLAAAYAQQIGTLVFTGAGTGSGTGSVMNGLGAATIANTVTWTQASPTPAGFYGQTGKLLAAFLAARLAPPTHWVMNPRRWFWLESAVDSNGRPLVVPVGAAFNPIAVENNVMAMGVVGYFHGLPVVIDPLAPINGGQDLVYLIKADDLVLLESAPTVEMFREPYADSLAVLVRIYGYAATILNRHPESIGLLTGTGLAAPAFAS